MKILHTADWHLGQKFKQHLDRIDEHRHVMDWLSELIQQEGIDLLVVAGDIFDTPNPPNNARELYYRFLVDAGRSGCRHIVITGGNHDSPQMLNAPKPVLNAVNTHVIGCATSDIKDEIIPLYNAKCELEAIVAAVPFLRDRDLKTGVSGEGGEDRIQRIKAGIRAHYEAAAEVVEAYQNPNIPIIATGHLYAKGAQASDKQDNIYIGNMENITASAFPDAFDYVALGHIHKSQIIGKQLHIRYSGSLIPMSFGEWEDDKSVTIVEFDGKRIRDIRIVPAPLSRKLVSLRGTEKDVEAALLDIISDVRQSETPLEAWVEILLKETETRLDISQYFKDLAEGSPVRVLRVSYDQQHRAANALSTEYELDQLEPLDIFRKRCEAAQLEPREKQRAENTFRELLDWMSDN